MPNLHDCQVGLGKRCRGSLLRSVPLDPAKGWLLRPQESDAVLTQYMLGYLSAMQAQAGWRSFCGFGQLSRLTSGGQLQSLGGKCSTGSAPAGSGHRQGQRSGPVPPARPPGSCHCLQCQVTSFSGSCRGM